MGTSTAYSAPPSWVDHKGAVTRAATSGSVSASKARELVRSFIGHNGGPSGMARGGSRGGSVGSGRAARAVAGRVAGFISEVGRYGLDEALRRSGFADLVGRPVGELLNGLLDRLGGPASTLDDADARAALSRLQEKYLAHAEDAAEVEQILQGQMTNLTEMLEEYFGFYLNELFCRVYFERLLQRVGETAAYSFLKDIEDFIGATLTNRTVGRDLSGVDWSGQEGQTIISEIMETTLAVFGG